MNSDTAQGNWSEIKGKIKQKWGKLTDDEVESFKGNMDSISGKIQKAYGYAKEKAESEFNDFKQTLAAKANQKIDQTKKNQS